MHSEKPSGSIFIMQRILLPVVAALGLATGCYTTGDVGVGYSYGYAAPAPSLYYVSPGVSVVAYSEYPVFYADNYYWMYNGGVWYRSSYYGGGWVVWHDVPYHIRSIDRPYRYARYRPDPRYSRPVYTSHGNVRDHRTYSRTHRPGPTPTVRDHRQPYRNTYRPAPVRTAPTVRDHRSTHTAPPRTHAPATRPTYGVSQPARAPAARDHRAAPAPSQRSTPPSRPTTRDHRRR